MRIKEVYPANHDHPDAGTFEIYYKGALSTDGGVWGSSAKGSDQPSRSGEVRLITPEKRRSVLSPRYSPSRGMTSGS